MVKRRNEEQVAGVLEFEGRASEDPEFKDWLAEHTGLRNIRRATGGNVRVSRGGKGVRVMFSKEADMALWKARAEQADKGKKPHFS